jgi:tryptophan-rich sensory protein
MQGKYRWWHGALFYGAVLGAGEALTRVAGTPDRTFYERQNLPAFAPPAAAFPIAWGVNSICAVYGLIHVLNLPEKTRGRTGYLRWQAAAWALFASFQAAYFGLRSPINAAAVTALYTAATAASLYEAVAQMRDARAAWALGTTAAWLLLANPVAIFQLLQNRDEFWNVGPFI